MTGRPPHYTIAVPFCMLLVSLYVTPAPIEAGLLEKVKATTPSLASVPLIKAIGDYTKGVLEEGTALVKEGLSGKVDAATYNRRADDFLDRKANLGVTAFLQDAADNLKLKVSNPLAGLKEKLGDTRLGRAAASVKEKLWATATESTGTGVAKPDEQYGAIDPRIALDVQEEETEWYQNETGIMDETSLSVAYLNEEIDSLDDAQEGSHWEAQYQDEDRWADETAVARRADEVQKRDPWTDIDDGADEWEERAADCTNPWVDIDADPGACGDGYQGDSDSSEETDVAGLYDEAQEGSYQEAMDRLLGNEPASYSDEYSVSDEGYEGALARLEAEAAERERQARLAAEAAERKRRAAERERLARLAAEEAEREREAWLAAEAAERERRADAKRSDAGGALLGALFGGVVRGLEDSGELEAGTSDLLAGIAGSSQGSNGGFNSGLSQSLNALNAMNALSSRTPSYGTGGVSSGGSQSCPGQSSLQARIEQVSAKLNGGAGMCLSAREAEPVFRQAVSFYQNCPAADPTGQMLQYSRDMIAWANETEQQACNTNESLNSGVMQQYNSPARRKNNPSLSRNKRPSNCIDPRSCGMGP